MKTVVFVDELLLVNFAAALPCWRRRGLPRWRYYIK